MKDQSKLLVGVLLAGVYVFAAALSPVLGSASESPNLDEYISWYITREDGGVDAPDALQVRISESVRPLLISERVVRNTVPILVRGDGGQRGWACRIPKQGMDLVCTVVQLQKQVRMLERKVKRLQLQREADATLSRRD